MSLVKWMPIPSMSWVVALPFEFVAYVTEHQSSPVYLTTTHQFVLWEHNEVHKL